jgi:hypothetical protein
MSLDYESKSSVLLGRPSALFADLSAEVIKVEPPRGDSRRRWFKAIRLDVGIQPTFAPWQELRTTRCLTCSGSRCGRLQHQGRPVPAQFEVNSHWLVW